MPETESEPTSGGVLIDAGVFTGVTSVYTYDADDWKVFESGGLRIVGPPSTIARFSSVLPDR